MKTDRLLRPLLSLALSSAVSIFGAVYAAKAQSSNAIRIVVPAGPGSPPDATARLIAAELSESKAWRAIVENRPGGLATIAMADVLKQPADGHTVILLDLPMMTAPALFPNLGLRVETDFAAVIKISGQYNVLVVNPAVPAYSIPELIGILKSRPDQFTFSSGSFGTPAHLVGELFKLQTGVRVTNVPYQTPHQRLMDLIAGINQIDFLATSLAVDLVATGKVRALAVTAPKRLLALKDVPTVVEQGFPELVVESWFGFAVKTGTPKEVVSRLNEAVNTVLAKQKIHDALAKLGGEPAGGTSAEFETLVKSQVAYWEKVVRDSGLTIPR
jgi:tripartite-type tricarboxylate transporter receptor subunit TctC